MERDLSALAVQGRQENPQAMYFIYIIGKFHPAAISRGNVLVPGFTVGHISLQDLGNSGVKTVAVLGKDCPVKLT